MKQLIGIVIFSLAIMTGINAQSIIEDQELTIRTDEILDQSIYMDAEEKICYVDLEKVPVNLWQAALINDHGDEVAVKSLADQPVNTIIEFDYSALPEGPYVLELRSYTGKTQKAVNL